MINQDKFARLKEAMKPLDTAASMSGLFSRIHDMNEPIRQIHEEQTELMRTASESIQRKFGSVLQMPKISNQYIELQQQLAEFTRRMGEVVEETPKSLLLLSQYCWYIDYDCDLGLPLQLAKLIEDQKIDRLDAFLMQYYSEKYHEIIDCLIKRHSKRKEIFTQIETAHTNQLFFIVIPSLLAQVDGISDDFTKKKFFLKDKENDYLPALTAEIQKIPKMTMDIFISPLKIQTPITARESDIHKFPIQLNRNEILHGVDKNYGTELNSLKCLSLIKYLSDILVEME